MKTLTWDQFTNNVQNWAKERGIYEHSTPFAQAMKAGSEAGELVDAVIKAEHEEILDAIGDICVCLVNYAHMTHNNIGLGDAQLVEHEPWDDFYINLYAASAFLQVGEIIMKSACSRYDTDHVNIKSAMLFLEALALSLGVTLMDCCKSAWLEIKDRQGKIVEGGAFVKDE